MFTIDQIKTAHAKCKTGLDFASYIRDIKALGVTGYATYVTDGHTEYFGPNGFRIQSAALHDFFMIARKSDQAALAHCLLIHQAGKTDYPTFCRQAAETGVEKWEVMTGDMTCVYYDLDGNELVTENIPA